MAESAFGVDHGEIAKWANPLRGSRMRLVATQQARHTPDGGTLKMREGNRFLNPKVKSTERKYSKESGKTLEYRHDIGGGLTKTGKATVAGLGAAGVGGAAAVGHKQKDKFSKAGFRLPGSSAFRGGGAQAGGGQGISAALKPQKPTFQGGPQKPGGAGSTFAGGPQKPAGAGGFAGGPAKPAGGVKKPQGPMQAFMAGKQKRMGMGMQKRPGAGVSSAPSAGFGSSGSRP